MGELAVTADAGTVLTTIGLGSCVAVALLDSASDAVGLAHVIFPKAPARAVAEHGKYADTAVPALITALGRLGSPSTRLVAVLAGGARMFSFERGPRPRHRQAQPDRGRRCACRLRDSGPGRTDARLDRPQRAG